MGSGISEPPSCVPENFVERQDAKVERRGVPAFGGIDIRVCDVRTERRGIPAPPEAAHDPEEQRQTRMSVPPPTGMSVPPQTGMPVPPVRRSGPTRDNSPSLAVLPGRLGVLASRRLLLRPHAGQ